MARNAQRKARLPFTPVRGKQRSDITPADHYALRNLLLSNPRLALGLFAQSNIGCLHELGFWARLCRLYPQESRHIAQIAAQMGIRERPEKPEARR